MLPKPIDSKSCLPWEKGFKLQVADKKLPGVSIVIPIFNSERFLEKTLRSLLCNDLAGIELIVMDGGSTDNTEEILNYYRKYFTVCVSEKDRGQSDAINKGFARATKPILYWLNGDDLILPNTLVEVRREFARRPNAHVVVGDAYMTELDLNPIRHFRFSDESLRFSHLLDYAKNHLVQPSVFFSRQAWDACGPVGEDLHYAMDADLFLHMASKYSFFHLPVDIAYSVYHEECKTRGKRAESITELSLIQAKYGGLNEARKTLDILVDMFNKADSRKPAPATIECEKCKITERKLRAVISEFNANKQLLLDVAMEIGND